MFGIDAFVDRIFAEKKEHDPDPEKEKKDLKFRVERTLCLVVVKELGPSRLTEQLMRAVEDKTPPHDKELFDYLQMYVPNKDWNKIIVQEAFEEMRKRYLKL